MRTVGEVARLAGVTVRTLHHYDGIGLVQPSGRSAAGYRLYAEPDLERLQTVLFYRELGFALDDIRAAVDDPTFDRGDALRQQRDLLAGEHRRVGRLLAALDAAIDAHEGGRTMSEEELFEVFGDQQRELRAEAEERWGDTDAWAQSRRRTRGYTRDDWEEVKAESEAITARIAEVHRAGQPADSSDAMDAVEAHREQISRRFYDCSHEMQVGLGEMYVQDPRFAATYEAIAPGLAVWVRDAIRANAVRAGVR
jgi:MerR family transcriptional regulator, thiopeptide resistance regulator